MLNSLVAMRLKTIWLLYLCLTTSLSLVAATPFQTSFEVIIRSPQPGEAVQGLVQITGSTRVEGFISYELSFSFEDDPTGTSFLIQQSREPVNYDVLGEWDTSVLTDGTYTLQLMVERQGGAPVSTFVEGLRVRNYSPIETHTPSPLQTFVLQDALNTTPSSIQPAHTPTPKPTLTPLAKNPAELHTSQITSAMVCGGILAIIVLGLLGFYVTARQRG